MLNKKWFIIILISAAAIVPYLNTFSNDFAYDDGDFFLNWSGIKKVSLGSFFSGDAPMYFHHSYRPIRTIIQSIVYQFSSENPLGYHVFALIVHLLNTFLIYLISKKLFNKTAGLVTAVVFALLPIHTMSVTFITASFNTAGLVFLLASFYFYILFRELFKKKYFYFSLILALLAFFTYELTLILPLLLILYDLCFKKFRFKYYLSYFMGALLFFIIRSAVLGKIYQGQFLIKIDFFSRMLTMSKALIKYIYLVIFNFPLSVHYETKIISSINFEVCFSVLLILGLLASAIFLFKRGQKIWTFIILWFFISLLPVSNIIPIAFFVSEQYLYLASLSWALLLGIVFCKYRNKFLSISLIGLCLFYGYLTWSSNQVWKNDGVLWQNVLAKQPNSVKAYINLATYYRDEKNYEQAQEYFGKAIEINPDYSLAYSGLGRMMIEQEKFSQAIEYLNQAISLRSDYASSYHNLGFSYHNLGQLAEAEENYKKAIEIYPRYYQSHKNLAVLYLGQERYDQAIVEFRETLKLQQDDYELWFGLGLSYLYKGEKSLAQEYFQKTLKINPAFGPAQEKLNQL